MTTRPPDDTNVADIVRARVRVTGLVQGVFFRETLRRAATIHGVSGWARNRPDGSVEAVFEGWPAAVEAMIEVAGEGPDAARVDSREVHWERPAGERGFETG